MQKAIVVKYDLSKSVKKHDEAQQAALAELDALLAPPIRTNRS